NESSPHSGGLAEGGKNLFHRSASGGPLPRGCLLSRATGFWLRRNCFLLLQLLDDAAGLLRVDSDSGAHGSCQRDLPDVAALRRGRLRADDLVDQRGVVLHELARVEALLADCHVDVRAAVGAVFELAGLRVAN